MLFNISFLDAATPWIVGFQDPATPVIVVIIHFYNHLIFFLVAIGVFVCWIFYRALVLFTQSEIHIKASKFTHSTPLEIDWTITPALLLLLIAGPSFALSYSIDEVIAPNIRLKVIGHQWYWSYEYSDYLNTKTGKTLRIDSCFRVETKLPKKNSITLLFTSLGTALEWFHYFNSILAPGEGSCSFCKGVNGAFSYIFSWIWTHVLNPLSLWASGFKDVELLHFMGSFVIVFSFFFFYC